MPLCTVAGGAPRHPHQSKAFFRGQYYAAFRVFNLAACIYPLPPGVRSESGIGLHHAEPRMDPTDRGEHMWLEVPENGGHTRAVDEQEVGDTLCVCGLNGC